ncbi:MBL fold metallo-hydrolase [Patescibacteria group bacterium]|nr:MBL fold metallo-hydrolase [Patescibacteria group bacterium]
MKIKDIELKWLGHSGFLIKNHKVIYIDPYNLKGDLELADIILITHSHHDHCSYPDLTKIVKEGTKILVSSGCQSKIAKFKVPIKIYLLEPGQEIDLGDIKIDSFPAYNTDKHFHPVEEGGLGYIIKFENVVIYHAGDTDIIPEMQKITGYKHADKELIALLPVGGRFTMSAEEAAQAAKIIKPNLAIPMHWGTIIGGEEDAKEFVELCNENKINAKILEKE